MAQISFTISAAPGILNDLIAVIYKTTSPAAEVDRIVDSSDHSSPVNFQFNDLASGIYIVKIHESADGVTLGNLRHDFWIDSSSNQILFERRFYTVGGAGTYDPADGATAITDPYFSGKTVFGVFKEGFRFLQDSTEWTQADDTINLLAGISCSSDEIISVDIYYAVESNGTGVIPFSDIISITADTTLDSTYFDKIIIATPSGTKLTATIPFLATIPDGKGIEIHHDGGYAINVVIQLQSGEYARFLGQDRNTIVLGIGEHIRLIKKSGKLYEVKRFGQWERVGEVIPWRSTVRVNGLFLDGAEYDLNTYVRLFDLINSLPPAQVVTYADYDLTTTIDGDTVYYNRGFFAYDSVNNKCKVPDLRNTHVRFLKNYLGTDASRVTNLPGGYQHDGNRAHVHSGGITPHVGIGGILEGYGPGNAPGSDNYDPANTGSQGNAEATVKNIGFVPILLI